MLIKWILNNEAYKSNVMPHNTASIIAGLLKAGATVTTVVEQLQPVTDEYFYDLMVNDVNKLNRPKSTQLK